jgi:hypothetical protein
VCSGCIARAVRPTGLEPKGFELKGLEPKGFESEVLELERCSTSREAQRSKGAEFLEVLRLAGLGIRRCPNRKRTASKDVTEHVRERGSRFRKKTRRTTNTCANVSTEVPEDRERREMQVDLSAGAAKFRCERKSVLKDR